MTWAPDDVGNVPLQLLVREHMPSHPIARHFDRTRDFSPVTIHEVVDEYTWHNSAGHDALRSYVGAVYQLAVPVPTIHHGLGSLMISRSGRDFTDDDRALARRIQPLLAHVDDRLAELERLRELSSSAASGEIDHRAREMGITPREHTVLMLLNDGLTASAIARKLTLSVHTVSKHQENLYRKFGTHDRLTTVLLAQKLGLVAGSLPNLPHQWCERSRYSVLARERVGPLL
jgi:DNA-binding CsgD family transcriptional regulator